MQVIGFTDEEIMAVFQLVASVLKLGNVTFDPKSNKNGTEACEITKASSKGELNDIFFTMLRWNAMEISSWM